jgi:hypothetical protein
LCSLRAPVQKGVDRADRNKAASADFDRRQLSVIEQPIERRSRYAACRSRFRDAQRATLDRWPLLCLKRLGHLTASFDARADSRASLAVAEDMYPAAPVYNPAGRLLKDRPIFGVPL